MWSSGKVTPTSSFSNARAKRVWEVKETKKLYIAGRALMLPKRAHIQLQKDEDIRSGPERRIGLASMYDQQRANGRMD